MTSNIPVGPALSAGGPNADGPGASEHRASDAEVRAALLSHFKPEFVNRLDDIVRFHPLSREQIAEIVDLQAHRLIERVAQRGVEVVLTDDAKQLLGDLGYDPAYGARPLRRVIQKQLVDRLALSLLQGEFREGDAVQVAAADGELVFERAASAVPTS
jgi:ATP-dependent Clp protease ATP-binding subunit ClpB